MRFSSALVSSLFASVVLADCHHERLAERINQPSDYKAGVALSKSDATFDTVAANITVPILSGTPGSDATAWVGIDGVTCPNVVLRAGVYMTFGKDKSSVYEAWSQIYPQDIIWYPDMKIFPGDTIELRVNEWLDMGFGLTELRNHNTGQTSFHYLQVNASQVCGMDAQWIVECWRNGDGDTPFDTLTNFGKVTFRNIVAHGAAGYYKPTDGPHAVFNIKQDNHVVTSTSFTESFVTVEHV